MLAKPHQAPFASWITGWFNFLGQVAITMGIRFILLPLFNHLTPKSLFVCCQLGNGELYRGRFNVWKSLLRTERESHGCPFLVTSSIMTLTWQNRSASTPAYLWAKVFFFFPRSPYTTNVLLGLINTFGIHLLKYIVNLSVTWHIIGTISIVAATLSTAPTHRSAHFVFTTFVD